MIESFKLPNITPETITGSIVSFNDEYGGLPLKSCTSLISGYQEGSGIPSPVNERPLHAFSSGTLNKTKKNLFNSSLVNPIVYNAQGDKSSGNIFKQAGTYTINAHKSDLAGYCFAKVVDGNGNYGTSYYVKSGSTLTAVTLTVPINGKLLVYTEVPQMSAPEFFDGIEIQVEFGEQATAYEPFGNSYTFTFGQTIYQGSIDWKRGVVVCNYTIVNLSAYIWEYIDSQTSGYEYGYFRISGNIENMTSIVGLKCEIFKNEVHSRIELEDNEIGRYNSSSFNRRLCVRCDSCNTITDFNNLISNKKIAYELATPIEIPLGGINLLTQQGVNNIFADCGNTEVKRLKVN